MIFLNITVAVLTVYTYIQIDMNCYGLSPDNTP